MNFTRYRIAPQVFCAALGALACLGLGQARAASPPDITGVWMVQRPYQLGAPLSPTPPLTPLAKGIVDRREAARLAGYVRSVDNMLCEGDGGPLVSQMRSPFEIFSGFGRMTMIFENETFNQPRTFYLNEKAQPDDIFPSFNGHSIAHWEGETLVVDTVGFNGRGSEPGVFPRSDKAHLTERFTLSPDGQTLTDQVTVEDPVMLTAPWTVSLKYDRKPATEERMEVVCDVDLEALKRTDLQALKAVDPEVARLLDPEQNGSDPALRIPAPKP
jgi:hypothetical protein